MSMIQEVAGLDKEQLSQYLAAMLAAISPAMMQAVEKDVARQAQQAEQNAKNTGMAQNMARQEGLTADVEAPRRNKDTYTEYDQQILEDGRVVKRFKDGTVRVENPATGLIQEERKDGTFLVSLPGGRLLYQAFSGDPLLAYNLNELNSKPVVAQAAMSNLPGRLEPGLVYTFYDDGMMHVIDAEGLRYFRTKSAPPTAGGPPPAPTAAQAAGVGQKISG